MIRETSKRILNQSGFTLAEIVVVGGISAVVMLGSAAILMQTANSQRMAVNDESVVATAKLFGKWLQPVRVGVLPRACSSTLKIDTAYNAGFNPNGQTDITIQPSDADPVYAQTSIVGDPGFKIERLYLDDVMLATDLVTKKLYVANVYLKTSKTNLQGINMISRPRNVGAVALTVLNSDQSMESCNVEPLVDSQQLCSELAGMVWSGGKCNQRIDTAPAPATNQLMCMPGFTNRSGTCKPIATNCGGGKLATQFNFAQVMNCTTPPTSIVAPVLTSVAVVPPNAPTPPPPTVASPVIFITTTHPATGVTAPATTAVPPASCTDGTALGQATQKPCFQGASFSSSVSMQGFNCQPQITPPPVANNCTVVAPTTYTTPTLTAAIQPSPIPPPADTSCTCNNYKVSQGDHCMYCIRNANLGFGMVDYAYGVSVCTAGNLVPVANPGLDPTNCTNNYSRAVLTGSNRFGQLNEYK